MECEKLDFDCSKLKYVCEKSFLEVYCRLIQVAKNRGTITYKCIAEIMGLPTSGSYMGKETGRMLGEISSFENKCGRPMISIVVVKSDGSGCGDGFYNLAKELGKFDSNKENEEQFHQRVLDEVYVLWQKDCKC